MSVLLAKNGAREAILCRLSELISPLVYAEIERIGASRADFPIGLTELRLRRFGRSSMVLSGENILLSYRPGEKDMERLLDKLTGGSLYAHSSQLKDGFISVGDGIRVGVYGDSELVSASDVSGVVIRLPLGRCSCIEGIFNEWQRHCKRGMLIYSLPGGGKTTALRALAGKLGGECGMRVAVIDERREFIREEYIDATVDIVCGSSKARGIEMAIRTLSPEVLIVDEIGAEEECRALLGVGRGGVPIIATSHAGGIDELLEKRSVAPLIRAGYFDRFVGLYRDRGGFRFCSSGLGEG
ncbi:MAG: AAA family ATPase [Ruminococcaceae bacterium]|nr:AAA family ATPase [Oscillospiraceae bacterium]